MSQEKKESVALIVALLTAILEQTEKEQFSEAIKHLRAAVSAIGRIGPEHEAGPAAVGETPSSPSQLSAGGPDTGVVRPGRRIRGRQPVITSFFGGDDYVRDPSIGWNNNGIAI